MIIAIDGPTASGKGTVAKMLATKLGFLCLDTGACYRAITVFFLKNGIDHTNPESYIPALEELEVFARCNPDGSVSLFINDEDITERLRDNEVSVCVPHIAHLPEVRVKVRKIQHKIAELNNGLVCEGRDTTSVVFPNADFKFYLDAKLNVRAYRRYMQLRSSGENIPLSQIKREIIARDEADMTRAESPLIRVKDAIYINCSRQSPHKTVERLFKIITKRIKNQISSGFSR
ncbi:MAG: (d)CMP kinase [Christensenellaceae bacterium]|jgi:cytidylate kinase|nr:(d)CMP kinase [Christensenellaceae bacterium]